MVQSTSPPVTITATAPYLCTGGYVHLTANASGYQSLSWYNGSNSPTLNWISSGGVYSVTVVSALGCVSTASYSVVAASPPTLTLTPANAVVCSGWDTPVALTISGASTYTWSTGSTSTIVQPTGAGIYSVVGANAQSCTASASVNLGTLSGGVPSLTGVAAICGSVPASLTASGGSTYRWSTGATTPVVSVSSSGLYSVTIVNSQGCQSVKSLSVTVVTPPTISASSSTITSGQSVNLLSDGCSGTVTWFIEPTSTNIGIGTTRTVTPTVSTTYTATCTLNNCASSKSQALLITVR